LDGRKYLKEILRKLVKGDISLDKAEKLIRLSNLEQIEEIAKLDTGREIRKGIPEIILAFGKNIDDTSKIAFTLVKKRGKAIISRATDRNFKSIKSKVTRNMIVIYHERSGMIVIKKKNLIENIKGKIGIITAGTADINVAEEAKVVAEEMECKVFARYDVGVAGIHRLFTPLKEMIVNDVDVIIVVAGMEGALPSIVASLVDIPIIAVPTSTSFGFGKRGISALMAMLQSCSLGMAVVNIDNGVGAGSIAALIARKIRK
jgi:NCAIR mutase (PurE)-related protein